MADSIGSLSLSMIISELRCVTSCQQLSPHQLCHDSDDVELLSIIKLCAALLKFSAHARMAESSLPAPPGRPGDRGSGGVRDPASAVLRMESTLSTANKDKDVEIRQSH